MLLKARGMTLMFAVTVVLGACSGTSTTSRHVPTPSATGGIATATPTLPPLSNIAGFSTALRLGMGTDGQAITGGAFEASNGYIIVVACEGNGNMVVDYEPQGTTTFVCSPDPRTFAIPVGSSDHQPPHEAVSVNISADSGVVWSALVEVKQ